jgi:hypothetical protein
MIYGCVSVRFWWIVCVPGLTVRVHNLVLISLKGFQVSFVAPSLIKLLGWKAYVLFKLMSLVLILCSNMLCYLTMHALHGVLCSSLTLVPSGPAFVGKVRQYHMGLLPVLVPGHCVQTIDCCVYVIFVCDLRLCCTVSNSMVLILYKHFITLY